MHQEYTQLAKDAANRWTDAIFQVKGYVRDKFNIADAQLDKEFGIPADFDYLE